MRVIHTLISAVIVIAGFHALARCAMAGEFYSVQCSGGRSSIGCVVTHGDMSAEPHVIHVPQIERSAKREAAWETFCKPSIRVDQYGVERYSYAHPGCEFGRTE